MAYLKFIQKNSTLLVFGIIITLFSSFGQTFILALYVPFLMSDFQLNNTDISGFYAIATIGSALILPTLGKYIDRINLRNYTMAATLLYVGSLLFLSWVHVWWLLPLAFFGLRLAGQGLFSHISITAMSRYFDKGRGKAISLASLGHPLGQAILPLLLLALIGWVGWRESLWVSVAMVLVLIPAFLFLLIKDKHLVNKEVAVPEKAEPKKTQDKIRQRDLIKSKNFWLLAPNLAMLSFAITTLFFYQFAIAEYKGWDMEWMAAGLTAFAVAGSLATLAAGPLIDKYSAKKFFPFYMIPFLAALVSIWLFDSPIIIMVYMVLMGVSAGFGNATVAALQVEFFGPVYIGTVRSLFASIMVLSSALGPAAFGFIIDAGYSLDYIFIITGVMMLIIIAQSFKTIPGFTLHKFKLSKLYYSRFKL
ncbi:MAG: MFS transporter [Anditalea sp.]